MPEKRMFTKKITESDAFLEMPLSTQCLYFHLNMFADDDGFVNSPKRVVRTIGANEDDLKLLISKSFILVSPFLCCFLFLFKSKNAHPRTPSEVQK